MMLYRPKNVTRKQQAIITLIFQFRGLIYDQLIDELSYRFAGGPPTFSFRKNTYKDLQKLEDMDMIERAPIKLSRTKDLISLTEAGLEYVKELLGILPGHVGSGWGNDWGDFPIELQRPPRPSSPAIYHHLMLTDILLQLERIKNENPQWSVDYRDNRYASERFDLDGVTYRFKPDGDILVSGRRFLLEVDRGTEFADKLREKFQSYRRYLEFKEWGGRRPIGVLFVCNKETALGFQKRWTLISKIFWEELSEWRTRFNLIAINDTGDLQKVIIRQLERQQRFDEFWQKVIRFQSDSTTFGTLQNPQEIEWSTDPHVSISRAHPEHRLFIFERVEQYETIGLARLFRLFEWFNAIKGKFKDTANVRHVIPVCVNLDSEPFPLVFPGFEQEGKLKAVFKRSLWANVQAGIVWTDQNGARIHTLEDW